MTDPVYCPVCGIAPCELEDARRELRELQAAEPVSLAAAERRVDSLSRTLDGLARLERMHEVAFLPEKDAA